MSRWTARRNFTANGPEKFRTAALILAAAQSRALSHGRRRDAGGLVYPPLSSRSSSPGRSAPEPKDHSSLENCRLFPGRWANQIPPFYFCQENQARFFSNKCPRMPRWWHFRAVWEVTSPESRTKCTKRRLLESVRSRASGLYLYIVASPKLFCERVALRGAVSGRVQSRPGTVLGVPLRTGGITLPRAGRRTRDSDAAVSSRPQPKMGFGLKLPE